VLSFELVGHEKGAKIKRQKAKGKKLEVRSKKKKGKMNCGFGMRIAEADPAPT
jgi:hypothetical protein